MNFNLILKLAIASAESLVEENEGKALEFVERKATLPEKDIRRACEAQKMTESQTLQAIALFRKIGDAVSDGVCFVASGGRIKPD